ncbi:hypothetical protein NE471_28130, partial [Escherichia coli]
GFNTRRITIFWMTWRAGVELTKVANASPEPFRLAADSTIVFLLRNPSLLHSVLRIPQNIIRLQPLHFSYEKGRRVSPCGPIRAQIAITAA